MSDSVQRRIDTLPSLNMILLLLLLAHGTFIGSIRLENKKPQQVPIDSHLHFGASTRVYIIRERPQNKIPTTGLGTDNKMNTEDTEGGLLGLPETEGELDVIITFESFYL